MTDQQQGREAISVIHINVPRATKARWVRESQAQGLKLTDWIIINLNACTMTATYTATIAHHSISRARTIEVTGTLTAAKAAATREFGDGFLDHRIVIRDEHGQTVASRRIGDRDWCNH